MSLTVVTNQDGIGGGVSGEEHDVGLQK